MKVKIEFSEESIFSKTNTLSITLNGIEEIHYKYPGSNRIAFEGEKTGYTYSISDIKEFEAINK